MEVKYKKMITKLNDKLLKELIKISAQYIQLPIKYFPWKKIKKKYPLHTLINILYYSDFRFYSKKEIRAIAHKYLSKNLDEMPLYIESEILPEEEQFYSSIPILARWRIFYNIK
jgi:hypothetical protein